MTSGTGPFRPFRKQLNAFARAATRIDELDVETVHRTRVASRRLREWVPVLRLDSVAATKLSRRLKKVTKRLGAVRELDVLMTMIQDLGRDVRYSPIALEQVSVAVERDLIAARNRVAARLPFAKIQRLTRRLQGAAKRRELDNARGHQTSTPQPKRAWVWAVEARATHRATGLRSAIETAGAVYAAERLHDVRIAVKKLRYAMELRAEARSQRLGRDIAALKDVQDLLGRLHDVEVLIARAQQAQVSLSPPALTAWRALDSLIHVLEDDCRVLHARYMQERDTLIAITDRVRDTKGRTAPVRRRAV